MKANELRLGNLVLYSDKNETPIPTTINIDISDLILLNNSVKDVLYEPIPLTEEWLLKLGFRRLDKYTFARNDIFIHMRKRGIVYSKKLILENLHQLQNLYFALTNEELTMK